MEIPLTTCVLPEIVRISIPKWSWKTTLAFWRFLSLSLFALFWDSITEKKKKGRGQLLKLPYVIKFCDPHHTFHFIFKFKLTLFSLDLFFFKFLYLLDDVIFLHLLVLNLRYHFRNGMLFAFQRCIFLFQVWGTNIASLQVHFHINNDAYEAALHIVPNKYGPIVCIRKWGIIQPWK